MPESFDTPTLARLVLAHVDASPDSLRFSPIRTGKHQFYLLYELQKYMPIRIWQRNDPAGARR